MWMLALAMAAVGAVLPAAAATPAAARAAVDTIPVGDNPLGVTVSPLGHRVYVADAGDDSVSVIDRSSNAVIATIPVGDSPAGWLWAGSEPSST
jgi:YVTN family beta-propeller protein